jgi:hypothetical protein
MAMTRIKLSGPLFDGHAQEAAERFCAEMTRELAEIGATWIKLDTQRMDKSGRGGTGAAAGGVEIVGQGPNWVIRGGIREGEYSWPWLEGESKRNQTTGFKGYHSFRRTRLRLRRQTTSRIEEVLQKYLAEMGGGEA